MSTLIDRVGLLRPLLRRTGTTAVIVLTLALGIGVNTGIYSFFHQVLLQQLDVPEPERLVVLQSPGPRSGAISTSGAGDSAQIFSFPMFQDLKNAGGGLEGIAGYRSFGVNLSSTARRWKSSA
jgi:hypothetical protein